jgi:hypothetical protein
MRPLLGDTALTPQQQELLPRRICELGLRIEGTRLEPLISELYVELAHAALDFEPRCYLADEWGCPQGVPVIGIPFYLASAELSQLEGLLTGVEAETDEEILMYLRHEAGHAFNYAFRLHTRRRWRRLFGSYSKPYRDEYRTRPFCARFVRNIPGWYAQKHPDEDFAETFAVWLTPGSHWRQHYASTPALEKLKYVARLARACGRQPPIITDDTEDAPVGSLTMTLAEWYGVSEEGETLVCNLPLVLNEDLRRVFPAHEGRLAVEILAAYRRELSEDLYRWTGLNRRLLRALVDELFRRIEELSLRIETNRVNERMISFSVLVTTLAMNYHNTRRFVDL